MCECVSVKKQSLRQLNNLHLPSPSFTSPSPSPPSGIHLTLHHLPLFHLSLPDTPEDDLDYTLSFYGFRSDASAEGTTAEYGKAPTKYRWDHTARTLDHLQANARRTKAFVLHGKSGSGKSWLMSKVIEGT